MAVWVLVLQRCVTSRLSLLCAGTVRVRKQTELEKRKASALKLLGLLTSMFKRRHFYEVGHGCV